MSDYRIKEATVENCNGFRSWRQRRFCAERRVRVFGLRLWWCPVEDGDWRDTREDAEKDMTRDRKLRCGSEIVAVYLARDDVK